MREAVNNGHLKDKDWFYSAPKKKRIKQTSRISRAVKNVASETYHFKLMVVNWMRFQVLDWVSCPEYFDEFWCLINKLIDGFSSFGDPGNDLRPRQDPARGSKTSWLWTKRCPSKGLGWNNEQKEFDLNELNVWSDFRSVEISINSMQPYWMDLNDGAALAPQLICSLGNFIWQDLGLNPPIYFFTRTIRPLLLGVLKVSSVARKHKGSIDVSTVMHENSFFDLS